MAKRDCDRRGYLRGRVRSDMVCKSQLLSIAKSVQDKTKIRKTQLGPRAIAWNEFKKSGKIDKACEAIAKVYGETTFKKNVIIQWINEEMQKEEQIRNSKVCDEER